MTDPLTAALRERLMSEGRCGCVEVGCVCVLPEAHGGPHECDCGGSWDFVDGRFVAVAWPMSEGAYPLGRTAAGL
jgi:hypothetical protein